MTASCNILLFGAIFLTTTVAAAETLAGCKLDDPAFFPSATKERVADCLRTEDNINRRNPDGDTPLHLASKFASDAAVVRLLLRNGADHKLINGSKQTPLHLAAAYSTSPATVSSLVLYGAKLDARLEEKCTWNPITSCGTTPLHLAASRQEAADIVAALLALGADANARNEIGMRPLHLAAKAIPHTDIIDLLLQAGADATASNDDENAPLHLAAAYNPSVPVIQRLLDAGASPDQKGRDGTTPLMFAAGAEDDGAGMVLASFNLLLGHSKKPCVSDNEGRTALSVATENPAIRASEAYWQLHQNCSGK